MSLIIYKEGIFNNEAGIAPQIYEMRCYMQLRGEQGDFIYNQVNGSANKGRNLLVMPSVFYGQAEACGYCRTC